MVVDCAEIEIVESLDEEEQDEINVEPTYPDDVRDRIDEIKDSGSNTATIAVATIGGLGIAAAALSRRRNRGE